MSTEANSSSLGVAKTVVVEHVDSVVSGKTRAKDQLTIEAERFIVRNPWRAVGIAAGIGLIAGSLIALAPRSHPDS